jgi:predicted amino acid racemase
LLHGFGISVAAVTKLFCADERIVKAICCQSVDFLADSRLENIASYPKNDIKRMLLRAPAPDMAMEVVEYCDVSLNSEALTLKALSKAALDSNKNKPKKHGVILMIDMGDLREGIYYGNVKSITETVGLARELEGIDLLGIGVNLTCYGSVIPTSQNLNALCDIAHGLRQRFEISLPIISGGNSSSMYLLKKGQNSQMPSQISNLRLGEIIARGVETAYGRPFEGLKQDLIILEAQLVEIQNKPTVPEGEIGVNAFGERPIFKNKGNRLRGIVSVGRQDIDCAGIACLDEAVSVVGASSDHLIVDLTDSKRLYNVGDVLEFSMNYSAILRGFTSKYVKRTYIN